MGIDHEEAGHLMNDLDWAGAVQDIRAAVRHLKDTGSRKVFLPHTPLGNLIYVNSLIPFRLLLLASVWAVLSLLLPLLLCLRLMQVRTLVTVVLSFIDDW